MAYSYVDVELRRARATPAHDTPSPASTSEPQESILFLDVDGVLNQRDGQGLPPSVRSSSVEKLFPLDDALLLLLVRTLRRCFARGHRVRIVMSSDWRHEPQAIAALKDRLLVSFHKRGCQRSVVRKPRAPARRERAKTGVELHKSWGQGDVQLVVAINRMGCATGVVPRSTVRSVRQRLRAGGASDVWAIAVMLASQRALEIRDWLATHRVAPAVRWAALDDLPLAEGGKEVADSTFATHAVRTDKSTGLSRANATQLEDLLCGPRTDKASSDGEEATAAHHHHRLGMFLSRASSC